MATISLLPTFLRRGFSSHCIARRSTTPLTLQRFVPATKRCCATKSPAAGVPRRKREKSGGSLLLKCQDEIGIVSKVSDAILSHGCNMVGADLHVESASAATSDGDGDGARHDTFLCRFKFNYDDDDDADEPTAPLDVPSLEDRVGNVASQFVAEASLLFDDGRHVLFRPTVDDDVDASSRSSCTKRVVRKSGPARVGIFLSRREHCVIDLLNLIRSGDLTIRVPFVVSNHRRDEETSHVRRALTELGIPYHHIPADGRPRSEWESDVRDLVGPPPPPVGGDGSSDPRRSGTGSLTSTTTETDFLVLARYMQILSPSFLTWYGRPIVNIHHGLLPSFKGANPYRQAYDAGVKLIGATAHFVTDDLDEGPIIEQKVERVSHRDTIKSMRIKSEMLEATALRDAVRYLVENRVERVGGRTIVFT